MTPSQPPSENLRPVERFKPTNGLFAGYAGLVAAAVTIGYVALYVHTVTGLRLALGALFFAVVVWVTQLRPRATAYPRHVVLRNSVRDAHVPYVAVDEVSMSQTLNVWSGGQRYVCIGIGQSLREEIKARRRREQASGGGRLTQFALRAERASTDERAMSYQTFVLTRLEELVDQAKREHRRDPDATHEPPRHVLAWPEMTALAVTGLAFVASLLL
jgi:hypothetical protein